MGEAFDENTLIMGHSSIQFNQWYCQIPMTNHMNLIVPGLCLWLEAKLAKAEHPCLLTSTSSCPVSVHMEPFSLQGYRILSTEILTWFITFEIWTRVEREIWTIPSKQIVNALTQHNNVIASLYWGSWTLPNRFTLHSAVLFLVGSPLLSKGRHLRHATRI